MNVIVLMVVLWAAGTSKPSVMSAVIPPNQDCGDVATAYIASHVTGNPNVMNVSWSCFEVPTPPEKEMGL